MKERGDKMKKTYLAAAILGSIGGIAQAQTVTIYGIVDLAVYDSAHMLNQDPIVGAPADPQVSKLASSSVVGLAGGGLNQSRIGFKGSEDLGNDLKAVFVLEDRFNPNDGSIANSVGSVANLGATKNLTSGGDGSVAGQLFNGQSNVGLASGTLGTVVFGRVNILAHDTVIALDPMHGSLMFSPLGYSGQYNGAGFTEDARADNTVKYTNQSGAFNYGFMYSFGGQAGATSAQSAVSLAAGYNNGALNVQGVWARHNDAISAGASGVIDTISLTFANTTGTLLGASYKMDKVTLSGGLELTTFNNPSNPLLDATTANLFGVAVTGTPNTTAYTNEKRQLMSWLGATYSFSPSFDLTGALYSAHQNDYSGGAASGGFTCVMKSTASGACSGLNQYASLLTDYHLSKRTDLYAGYMFNRVTGGFDVVGTLHSANDFVAAGVRHMF
jgi:GBP family porin